MVVWLKRGFLGFVAIAVVGAIVYAMLPQPVPVDAGVVSRGPLQVTVDEDGKTRLKDRYEVYAPLAGRMLRINLDAGDRIEAGVTHLATIEPSDPELLDARALAQAELRVKAAEAALKKVGPTLEAARAALEFAESEANRARQLHEKNSITKQEMENKILDERTRSEEFKAARFAEEIARFEYELAQAALLRTRPLSPEEQETWQVEIRAPISGSVLRVHQESAAVVAAGTPILEVGDPSELEMEIDVLSSDAVKMSPGTRVILEQWGGENPLEGIVRLVEPSAFTKISALGVEEQRVNVIVDFIDPPENRMTLGDGFRVEARIIIWEASDVLKVPASSLFRYEGDWAVFVIEEEMVRRQPVKIGHSNGLEAEVLAGITEGTDVVMHPSDRIQPGVKIVRR